MGTRKVILATGEVYHIFNHSVQGLPIFSGKRESRLFLEALRFYLQPLPPARFSIYRRSKDKYPIKLDQTLATVICYCLMPNHFHFLLKQEQKNGIKILIQKLSNSFAHYFCRKYKKRGHVFESNFKAVHVENEEQLVHLSRYIHLNPVTSYITEKPENYAFSSYRIYLGQEKSDFVDPKLILDNFSSKNKYKKFVLDQKDYQRVLQDAKHLFLE